MSVEVTSEHLEQLELGVVNWVKRLYARWGSGLGGEPEISAEMLASPGFVKKPKGMKKPKPAVWLELVREAADSLRADGWLESTVVDGVRLYEPGVPILRAMEPRPHERQPVILSYGMGVDSSAILTRWLLEPWSRDFELEDLVVLTAQTGDEFPETGRQVAEHILPMLEEHGIRFVQVARSTLKGGMTLLADTARGDPYEVYLPGDYRLSDELLTQATVPQYQSGRRLCSIKAKGWPLDAWIDGYTQGRHFRHVIGFNADELSRAQRDSSYSEVERHSEYPLFDWGWGRAEVEDYLEDVFGEVWLKSCCVFCPFTSAKEAHIERLGEAPNEATYALLVEHCSLAFNLNQGLYSQPRISIPKLNKLRRLEDPTDEELRLIANAPWTSRSLWRSLEDAEEDWLLDGFDVRLDKVPWGVYRLRRIVGGGDARSITKLEGGLTREQAMDELEDQAEEYGVEIEVDRRQGRVWFLARSADVAVVEGRSAAEVDEIRKENSAEDYIVAAPEYAVSKQRKGFEKRWEKRVVEDGKNRKRYRLGRTLD